jgi:hypothetical protein
MRMLPLPRPFNPTTASAIFPRLAAIAMIQLFRLAAGIAFIAPPASARDVQVPEALRPWKAWVAQDHPQLACPVHDEAGAVCVTYGSLKLDLGETGGSFTQSVTVFGKQWVRLPGNPDAWPKDVRDGSGALPVVLHSGSPQTQLAQGEHLITGSFAWSALPQSLLVPESSALLTLRLKGREVAVPEMSGGGELQLGAPERTDTAGGEAPLTLRVYRKLMDGIPMRLETYMTVSVSGREREIITGRFLPEGSAVLSIQSDLPLRIGADGRLRAQLRSGDHSVRVVSRFLEPIAKAGAARLDSLWPEEEIWSFEAQRDLRVVELNGAALIDPSQSGLPPEWKGLPAYRLLSGDTLRLEEKQRGNPSPAANDLRLVRDLWLDFAGKGFTVKDNLSGTLPLRSRLEMEGGFRLGRADAMGEAVMITSLKDKAGVEMPAGPLSVLALSRFDRGQGGLPATGWNQDFQGVQATLHLPPGWKLIHAEGPDVVGESWITDWSLWDVFLLCILTLGVLRLAGPVPALVALACFILLSQEAGLSGLLWLNLLAAMGLWKVLPEGKLRRLVNGYRIASFVLLAAIWIPFAIVHARKALYPQLDGPEPSAFSNSNYNMLDVAGGYAANSRNQGTAPEEAPMAAYAPAPQPGQQMEKGGNGAVDDLVEDNREVARLGARRGMPSGGFNQDYAQESKRKRFNSYASKVQSGPGEPAWGWESARLNWSGPVPAGEKVKLIMTRPWLTRILRALQALLPGALLLLLAFPAARAFRDGRDGRDGKGGKGGPGSDFRFGGPGGSGNSGATGASGAALAGLLIFLGSILAPAVPAVAGDFPPDTLLQQLAERMSAPRDCSPACADMNSGSVDVKGDRVVLTLVFDVADSAFAPLPKAGEGQLALEAIRLAGKPAAGAVKLSNGGLAIALPRGRHAVSMEGRILGPRLELNFGDKARNLTARAPEYSVQGLALGRTENGALVLQRREGATAAHKGPELTPDPVPPFVEVVRSLVLDQEWILETRVVRIAPAAGAFTVEVPLLTFEHPTTPGMAQSRGTAMVSLQEGQMETVWRSVVDRSSTITLAAGGLSQRSETWSVDASSRWHVESSGLSPMLPRSGRGGPEWKPMPGDTLSLAISEPEAASGAVKTIESAALTVRPGKREATGNLDLSVRAGQGDVTRVELPPSARLESMRVDGADQPLTQREGALAIPLHPGIQNIQLSWKQPDGIRILQKSPQVRLEDEAANLSLQIELPRDRWILWVGGNAIGPALLLWGVLAVLTGIAWLLGRARITPLGFADWALLFLGTSMVNVYATAPLLALFLALRHREKHAASWQPNGHNAFQVAAAALAVLAFGMLLAAVPEGLLSAPDMQITGNGSHAGALRWFQDRAHGAFPTGWVVSLPIWVYRLAMLAWSLWLALRLLQWLRWCWEKYSAGGLWRETPKKAVPPKAAPPGGPVSG